MIVGSASFRRWFTEVIQSGGFDASGLPETLSFVPIHGACAGSIVVVE